MLLILAGLAAAAVIATSQTMHRRSSAALIEVVDFSRNEAALNRVLRRLLDAETAQRGYLLTGRAEYLEPRKDVDSDLAQSLQLLEASYGADPKLHDLALQLKERTMEKMSELDATLQLYDAGEQQRWRDLLLTNIGREKMEDVRVLATQLLAASEARANQARSDLRTQLLWGRNGVLLLLFLSLSFLALYLLRKGQFESKLKHLNEDLRLQRDGLEEQVRARTNELTQLAQHLQLAREDERSRLARELHDEMGALLTAAKLDLARLRRALGPLTPELQERLQHLVEVINQGIALERSIIEDLRPSLLSNLGLVPALQVQAREFAQGSGLNLQTELDEVALTPDAQITVYRMIQEALSNIAKYASAQQVRIALRAQGQRVQVSIKDDGKGFDPAGLSGATNGLTSMRYRVQAAGGTLHIRTAPGQGTHLEASIPTAKPKGSDAC